MAIKFPIYEILKSMIEHLTQLFPNVDYFG